MSKPKWGEKRLCGDCGSRYYDLNRNPARCPKCGAEMKIAKPRARRAGLDRTAVPVKAVAASEALAVVEKTSPPEINLEDGDNIAAALNGDEGFDDGDNSDDDGDDSLIEDTSDLGDDDDDVSEVKEHLDVGLEDKV